MKAWEAERAKLKTEYAAIKEQYRPFADEAKKLWQVRYAVERARHEMGREQSAYEHKHEQER